MATRTRKKAKTASRSTKRRPSRRANHISSIRTDHALDMEARVLVQEAKAKRPKAKASRAKSSASGSMIKAGQRMLRKAAKEIGQLFEEPKGRKRRGRLSRKEAERMALMMAPGV